MGWDYLNNTPAAAESQGAAHRDLKAGTAAVPAYKRISSGYSNPAVSV